MAEAIITMFDKTVLSFSAMILMSKVALNAGSSQHGKARRASGAFIYCSKKVIHFQNTVNMFIIL